MSNDSKDIHTLMQSGKIGSLGLHSTGKTRTLRSLVNLMAKKNILIWDEEENYIGTATVNPLTPILPTKDKKIIVIDNPGQNVYAGLRKYVFSTGPAA